MRVVFHLILVASAAACGGSSTAATPIRAATKPVAPMPVPAPAPPPRPDCSSAAAASLAPDELRTLVEGEGCNGHAWDGRRTPLMHAAERGDADLVAFLLGAGAPVDFEMYGTGSAENGKTALWFAVSGEHADVVRVLLSAGSDPNRYPPGGVPLVILASIHDDVEVARLLVEAGGDPTQTTGTWGHSVTSFPGGPGAKVFAYLHGLGISTDGLTDEQVEALLWEASHEPAADASVEDRVAYLGEVIARARTGRSRGAAVQALGALGAGAAVKVLIDVVLAETVDPYDWSQVDAAQALLQVGWTPELDDALPDLLAELRTAPQQLLIGIVELISTHGPASKQVVDAFVDVIDDSADPDWGARGLEILLDRADVTWTKALRRKAEQAVKRFRSAASSS